MRILIPPDTLSYVGLIGACDTFIKIGLISLSDKFFDIGMIQYTDTLCFIGFVGKNDTFAYIGYIRSIDTLKKYINNKKNKLEIFLVYLMIHYTYSDLSTCFDTFMAYGVIHTSDTLSFLWIVR